MGLTIREKAATVATFRFTHVRLMEILAGWIPTTPELEVKILFGQHVWDTAQHADALGRRAYELRKPMHYSLPPSEAYVHVLETLATCQSTAERLHGFYDVLLPGLTTRYERYLAQTDRVLDAPTVRILERCAADAVQMRQASHALRHTHAGMGLSDAAWGQHLTRMEALPQDIVRRGPATPARQPAQTTARYSGETMQIRDLTLRRDPAREACFTVVHLATEMHEYTDMSAVSRRERLHRHMNNELGGLEIAAQCVADFPAAPWELRMQLARQCWDETRHVQLLYDRLQELGGYKGEFPIANLEWTLTCMLDTLPARLAVQNRTFEAGQTDLLGRLVERWREAGDERTAEMLEGILTDEIQHVRFANQWIKRLVQEDRRVVMHIATAMRFLANATTVLAAQPGEVNAVGTVLVDPRAHVPMVNVEDRQMADFTAEEIHEILRQAGFRSLTPRYATAEVTS